MRSIFNLWVTTFVLSNIGCEGDDGNLASFSLSPTSYPSQIYNLYSAYNSESDYPDCIFVFGGDGTGSGQGLYCFSISNQSLIEFDTLQVQSGGSYGSGIPGALMWYNETNGNDYIYYIFRRKNNPYIHRYNLDNRTDEYLTTLSGYSYSACMQFNPFNTSEILLVEAEGDAFGVYNIEYNTFILGKTLNHAILRESCVAIDNEYVSNEPYFYVFGSGYIQRLNLTTNNISNTTWETVQGSLEVSDSRCDGDWSTSGEIGHFGTILSSELIYLIGGYDESSATDCIISYNILTNSTNYVGLFETTIRGLTAILAQNRIYTFGGCTSSCSQGKAFIYYSNNLSIDNSYKSNYSSCDTHIESFRELTSESMPSADEQYRVVYNNKSSYNDCILVFGGYNADSDVLCFNLTSLTFTKNFSSPIFTSSTVLRLSRQDSLLIVNETSGDEFIYYTTRTETPSFYRFDIINGITTQLNGGSSVSSLSYPPCMLQNPFDDNQLLFMDGGGYDFVVYFISNDTFASGQSTNILLNRAFCVVIDNEYQDDEPYLYVFGGENIQRLKLNNNDGILNTDWEVMTQILYVNDSSCDSNWTDSNAYSLNGFLHHELIYLFYDCVISFNILNHNVEYVTHFSDVKRGFGGALVNDRIYTFGGCTDNSCSSSTASIYYSDDLCLLTNEPTTFPSTAPTISPSVSPTVNPSPPSSSPSIPPTPSPTVVPSAHPSAPPSIPPTGSPTIVPSVHPSAPPSKSPTGSPSQPPSVSPSQFPSVMPSGSPSQPPSTNPSEAPTTSPSNSPTVSPTAMPSISPTNSLCDIGVQTNNTFLLCSLIIEFESIFNGTIEDDSLEHLLHSENYCNVSQFSDYILCDSDDNSNEMITHIYFSNCNITGEMNDIIIDILNDLAQQGYLKVLDLSNNNIYGSIDNWSPFGYLNNLSLANNDFEDEFDIESLTSIAQNLEVIDISNNGFDGEIEWSEFEYLTGLTRLNLGYNEFDGEIEIVYFESCENFVYLNVEYNYFEAMDDLEDIDEYIPDIQELYINNNEIDEDFDVSYFSGTRELKILKCNNNSLRNGNLDMADIPESLKIFDCGFNDFGEIFWDALSYGDFLLEYISLKGAGIYGIITMAFFDNEDGGYPEIQYLDLSYNEDLNISVDFRYLDGQSNIYHINLLNTAAYGSVDFDYLIDDKNITILMSTNVWCVDSYCSGSTPYGYIRNNDRCYSKDDCEDTCECDTAYALGLEVFEESELSTVMFWTLGAVVTILTIVGIGERFIGITKYTFNIMGYYLFVLQIWDFFSDLLLFDDIFEHYQQASVDNPRRDIFEIYMILSAIFIALPFMANLGFLAYWKLKLSKTEGYDDNNNNNHEKFDNYDLVAGKVVQEWLQNHAYVLVVLCFFSGSLTASLKLVNSNLFGLKYFSMGLSKYKQEETGRHKIWLTILLENVPQIIIAFGYALETVGFGATVLGALASSTISVAIALFTVFLSFPKHYYFHVMQITLKKDDRYNVGMALTMKFEFKKIICQTLAIDKNKVLIENIRCITDDDNKEYILFDVVSSKPIVDDKDLRGSGFRMRKAGGNNNNNDSAKRKDDKFKNRIDVQSINSYRKTFNHHAIKKKRNLMLQLNKLYDQSVSKIKFEFDRYECIELKFDYNCFKRGDIASAQKRFVEYELHGIKSTHKLDIAASGLTNYNNTNTSDWYDWTSDKLCDWIEYKMKQGISEKEKRKQKRHENASSVEMVGENVDVGNNMRTSFLISQDIEHEISEFMNIFRDFGYNGDYLYTLRKADKKLNDLKDDMELPKNLKKYWIDFQNVISLLKMNNINISAPVAGSSVTDVDIKYDSESDTDENYGDGENVKSVTTPLKQKTTWKKKETNNTNNDNNNNNNNNNTDDATIGDAKQNK